MCRAVQDPEGLGRRKIVRTNLEKLRLARRLLDQYEELWRGRIDRTADLVADTKERDPGGPDAFAAKLRQVLGDRPG